MFLCYLDNLNSSFLLPFLHGASTPCDLLDQEFLVYFQKKTKIVRAKPDDHYRVYSIPINSAIKFVPLHKEDAKFTKAAWEGDFDNVADIAKLKVFPLVSTHACLLTFTHFLRVYSQQLLLVNSSDTCL